MKISILKSDSFETTNWFGGTTTEIYIHPKETSYQERNFDFRLSIAKVIDQETSFTPLPGIRRKLMVLKGEITLRHENYHRKKLGEFDVDTFEGNWKTYCSGNCVDFNLMMSGDTNGNLEGFSILKNEVVHRDISTRLEFVAVFTFIGKTNIDIAGELHPLNAGELMVIERPKTKNIRITALKNSSLVWLNINTK